MRIPDIDFRAPRKIPALSLALLLLGTAAAAGSSLWYLRLDDDIAQLESKVENLRRMTDRTAETFTESGADAEQTRQQVRIANAVMTRLIVPWDRLFDDLEAATASTIATDPQPVALLGVQPEIGSRQLRINGEAKDLEAVLDYVRRLNAGGLSDVVLTEHNVKTEDPQQPVAFSILAQWHDRI